VILEGLLATPPGDLLRDPELPDPQLVNFQGVFKDQYVLTYKSNPPRHHLSRTYNSVGPREVVSVLSMALEIYSLHTPLSPSSPSLHSHSLPRPSNVDTYVKSIPITSALGYRSAISIAQIPVPVPTSRIRCGFGLIGD
jgi:hypothetical protein